MTKLITLALVLAACGGPAAASPAPTTPAAPACDVAGTWELTVDGSGCPLPRSVKLVDGKGSSPHADNVPAMDWTLTATRSSAGTCEVALRGTAGRLFTVEATGTRTGATLTATGRAKAGETRYSCGGDVKLGGVRR